MAESQKNTRRDSTAKPERRSQRLKDARERHLSTAKDPFWLREESTLLLAFSHLRVHELLRCAAASKTWRKCIDHNAIAWTTAMWELDPLAVLGPKGAKAAVARLKVEQIADTGVAGKYWLLLAARLASRSCAGDDGSCNVRGFEMNTSTLTRLCVECKEDLDEYNAEEADEYKTLINDFMFDKEPSVQVTTAKEFLDATSTLPEGACVEIAGEIELTEDDARQLGSRVIYDPAHYRYRIRGASADAAIISRDHTVYFNCCKLQGLKIEAGADYDSDGHEIWNIYGRENEACFPSLEIICEGHLLLEDCSVRGGASSAIIVDSGGSLAIDGGQLSSANYTGLLLKDGKGEGARPTVSCRDCLFTKNFWGCYIPRDVEEKAVKSFIAANRFGHSWDKDVDQMVDDRFADVQPWRRGWATDVSI